MNIQINAKVEEVFLFTDGRTIFALVSDKIRALPFFKKVPCRLFVNDVLYREFCVYLENGWNRARPEMFCIGTLNKIDIDHETINNNDCHVEFIIET